MAVTESNLVGTGRDVLLFLVVSFKGRSKCDFFISGTAAETGKARAGYGNMIVVKFVGYPRRHTSVMRTPDVLTLILFTLNIFGRVKPFILTGPKPIWSRFSSMDFQMGAHFRDFPLIASSDLMSDALFPFLPLEPRGEGTAAGGANGSGAPNINWPTISVYEYIIMIKYIIIVKP